MEVLLTIATLLPLISALFIALFSFCLSRKAIELLGSGVILLSFLSFAFLYLKQAGVVYAPLFSWISFDTLSVQVALLLDPLSLLMALIITGVGFLIHWYSVGYMDHDTDVARFFSVMNFFIFSMLLLVLATDLLVLFVGWEGVGLASYLLIGFWYQRPAASKAAKKAFVVNRVGDLGLLLGILFAFTLFGTSDISQVTTASKGSFEITIMTLLIFWGATAKSAQIPLHVWLPDAMEGPTPVSALIHAATMVTAGVYLVVRLHPLFTLAPITLEVIATIGIATSLLAAISAISQQDLKRVLAYSTISQLGLMFLACGFKAYDAAMFHLTAHAFTKALLFLSAGNVIHMLSGTTEMNQMGGLAKNFPKTNVLFLIGALAMSAVPPFMPFFSKELILESVAAHKNYFLAAFFVSMLTAFYLTRAYLLTFRGPSRLAKGLIPHEAPAVMYVPCILLAFLAINGGFFFDFGKFHPTNESALAVICILLAILLAYIAYKKRASELRTGWKFSLYAFYINELYRLLFVIPCKATANIVNKIFEKQIVEPTMNCPATFSYKAASVFELVQNGQIRTYLAWFVLIGVALALFIVQMSGGFS
jgi:NADH-quinone oxidoreductase subunit L